LELGSLFVQIKLAGFFCGDLFAEAVDKCGARLRKIVGIALYFNVGLSFSILSTLPHGFHNTSQYHILKILKM